MDRVTALDRLPKHFTEDELRELAFLLEAESAITDRASRREIARELLEYCDARGLLGKLAATCKERRPEIDWASFLVTSEAPREPDRPPQPKTLEPPQNPQPQQVLPVVGVWNVSSAFGFVGTMAIHPNGVFQSNMPMGQATGSWWYNPVMNAVQSQGWLNGMPFNAMWQIQQWVPNGFVALGADGIVYTFLRTG